MSPSKLSSKKNPYFDIDVQTSPGKHSKVRVMENHNTKRILFLQKSEEKAPVQLKNLSPSKNLTFYNSNTGSRMDKTMDVNFLFTEDKQVTKVCDISEENTGSVVTIFGYIKWSQEKKNCHHWSHTETCTRWYFR